VRHAVYTGGFNSVIQQWTELANTPVATGEWIRCKISIDYTSDGRGDKYFTVELDGIVLVSSQAYNRFNPTDEGLHMGGSLFLCANSGNGGGSASLGKIKLDGNLRVDDLTVTTPASLTAGGTPFDWIQYYYPGSDYAAVALQDLDGDGLTTDQEFKAGTNPNDAGSALRLSITKLSNGNLELSWPSSLDGALTPFEIQVSTDLNSWSPEVSDLERDLSGFNTWIDSSGSSRLFYRLSY
jgi:hypothetical protein